VRLRALAALLSARIISNRPIRARQFVRDCDAGGGFTKYEYRKKSIVLKAVSKNRTVTLQVNNVLLLVKKRLVNTNFLSYVLLFMSNKRTSKNLLKLLLDWRRYG
jgi:hypothetical protein